MITLLGAVFFASLLGSLHCVGMCGPLALVATTGDRARSPLIGPAIAYHVSRLLGYVLLGTVAGLLGSAVQTTGDWLGFQQSAARIAGGAMALLGCLMVLRLSAGNSPHFLLPQGLQSLFSRLHQFARVQSPWLKAITIGALTIFLPCGWLYAFLITAAATATPLEGGAVMAMFWMGTLPSLSAMLFSAHLLTQRFKKQLPWVSALLLVAVGFYTMSHRAVASYEGLTHNRDLSNQKLLEVNTSVKPVCCQSK